MKKLIPGILALMMCFGTLAGCDQIDKIKDKIPFLPNKDSSTPAPDDSSTPGGSDSTPEAPTQAHAADLKAVRTLVFADMLEASDTANRSYSVPNSYSHDGKVYDVSWTVTDADGNAVTGVSVQEGDSNDTIIIDVTGADVNYVLTGTITCPEGCCSISHKFNRVAKEAPIHAPITEAPQENTPYIFYVWQAKAQTDCYLTANSKPNYPWYLLSDPDYANAVDLYIKNVDGGFNLYYTAEETEEIVYLNIRKDGSHTSSFYETIEENATPSVWRYDAEKGTIVTNLDNSVCYLGCNDSYTTVSAQYKTANDIYVGYLGTMKSKSEVVITKEQKVQDTLSALSFAEKYTLDVSNQILPTTGTKYAEVAITWTVDGNGAVLESNFLSFVIPTEASTVTVTATASCEGYSESKSFTIQLGPKSVEVEDKTDVAAILAAANNLAAGETLPGFYTLTGTITSVDTPWDSGFSNITVSFKVSDDVTMKCYRLKNADGVDAASTLKVGDVITVNGQITSYYGKLQFAQGCTLQAVTAGEGGESGDEGEVTPPVSDGLEEGIGYHLSARNSNGPIYFIGTITDGRFNASASIDESVPVYVENVDGGQLIYFFLDDVKTYVIFGDSTTGASTTTNNSEATVFEWNASLNTMVVADDINNRAFATNSSKDYVNFSAYDVSGSYYWAQYTAIEASAPHEHSYESVVTDPTCTEAGYTTYTCACGDTYTADEVPATGHSYDAVVTDPTCTVDGYTTYTCSICGDNYTEAGVAAAGHSYADGFCGTCGAPDPDYEAHEHKYEAVVTDPTCTETGYTTYTCACGDTYTADEVPATGHSYDAVVTDPTCTVDGYTTYTCACGDNYTEAGEAATGHTDEVADYKCDRCSTVMAPAADSTLTIPEAIALGKALGAGKYTTDKYYMTVTIESIYNTQYGNANVTDADGNKYVIYGLYTWNKETRYDAMEDKPVKGDEITVYGVIGSYNGTSVSYQMKDAWIDEVVAHEHDYNEAVTAPTCTADGYTTYTCNICDDTYTDNVVAATGHTTEAGICENCGKEIGGETAEPAVVATFDFGANGSAAHVDGNDLGASKSYTSGTYTLALTGMSKVYGPAYDAKGNSCIKLGTSKVVGAFSFTVPENVTSVVIKAAKYKSNTTKISVNGTSYTLTNNSNDGAYDEITVDTSTNKTVTFTTVSGGVRCMINAIEFIA